MTALREALATFRRAPLLSTMSVITIAFSLFAFGLFGLVVVNIREALHAAEERVEIRAFIVNGTSVATAKVAAADIAKFPEVLHTDYISQEQALEQARQDLEEFRDVFEPGVLPASIEIRLKPGFRSPDHVAAVADRLKAYDFIDDVRYGQAWIQKLYRLRVIATAVGGGLGLAFAFVAIMIIGATIRIIVHARAKEISIMRVVGATDSFIRLPFLLEGFIQGILGGLLALGLTWITHMAINRAFLTTTFFDPRTAALGVVTGAFIGLLGSAFAVGRHLRRV
jgi:cell division transport system permease protein